MTVDLILIPIAKDTVLKAEVTMYAEGRGHDVCVFVGRLEVPNVYKSHRQKGEARPSDDARPDPNIGCQAYGVEGKGHDVCVFVDGLEVPNVYKSHCQKWETN